ncbi:metal-sensitive transcriptional regulator [Lentilactobacillus hilgardii]|nr:metal-sensitive transcriptional regulator [Lentilactobacillus hilgardii]MCV3741466.1 metal-sensitive transcriptional regulator [Lentilactobacillus hilgardii]
MACDPKITNRLKRAEGQIRGILKMMDDDKSCREIMPQLMAVRSSVDKVMGLVVAENLRRCLDEDGTQHDEKLEEALKMISKL